MVKSIIKEIIIMLLLCVAILLILGILFYDYIPTNRIIPTREAYETPENVKQEINETVTELNEVESELYEVTDADLNIYKKSSIYKPGKANPFALEITEDGDIDADPDSTGDKGTTDNGNGGSLENPTDTQDSTESFFNDTK